MRVGLHNYFRLITEAYLPGKDGAARRSFRRLAVVTLLLAVLVPLQILHRIALGLDEILFRGYRQVKIRRPLFIVGVPRSGTTFLHRLIAKDQANFTCFPLWELLFAPAVCEKIVWLALFRLDSYAGSPLSRFWGHVERWLARGVDGIHRISLLEPEEDYFALLPICACFLLVLAFPSRSLIWPLAYFDDALPDRDRQWVMAFYRGIVQRHLYVRGPDKEFLSKNPSFSPLVRSLVQAFPEARFVACLRNPEQAAPSLLNSMQVGARLFGDGMGADEFRDQLLEMMKFYYRHLTTQLPRLAAEQYDFVRFDDLTADPQAVVRALYTRFGIRVGPEFAIQLAADSDEAKNYRSTHRYSLDQFGLTAAGLQRELHFVYQEFGFPLDDHGQAITRPHVSPGAYEAAQTTPSPQASLS